MSAKYRLTTFLFLGLFCLIACRSWRQTSYRLDRTESEQRLPENPQRRGGDPEAGFDYLVTGDHVGNGIPMPEYFKFFGETSDTILYREGDNARVSYSSNVFELDSGLKVVSGNCFVCHAARINGNLIFGLGNSFADFTENQRPLLSAMNLYIKSKYGKKSRVWEMYEEQAKWLEAVAAGVIMPNRGTNPAFRLEEAAIAYRDPRDLAFRSDPWYQLSEPAIGTDVPPLWNVKKKRALYYTGAGRGDFTKLLMQVSVLGIHDSAAARQVQQRFVDVLAWLEALEPPKFPQAVNREWALQGEKIFGLHCEKCHGSYGKEESYPNKLIPLTEVKTDPAYAAYTIQSTLNEWYNGSWYGQSPTPARLEDYYGYIAPPLDGIWATAPYLHNGSVPDLAALLNSRERPTYWTRSYDSYDFNYQRIGWNFLQADNGKNPNTYDTTRPGASAQGHTYGDVLNEQERKVLLEYLKTL